MDSYQVFKHSLAEFHAILLEEHLKVTLEMLEVGICYSFWSPKLTRVVQCCSNLVIVVTRNMLKFTFMLFKP
jgi:hypothetical protein